MNADTKTLEQRSREFREWFYSEPHRAKYSNDHPAYLSGWEAWQAATVAVAKEVRYHRGIVARMLEDYASLPWKTRQWRGDSALNQAYLLRSADEADAAGVGTVARCEQVSTTGIAVAWRSGNGYSVANEQVAKDLANWLSPPAASAVSDGWKLVPLEPTFDMMEAGSTSVRSDVRFPTPHTSRSRSAARNAYVTMLASAPSPETVGKA